MLIVTAVYFCRKSFKKWRPNNNNNNNNNGNNNGKGKGNGKKGGKWFKGKKKD